MPKRSGVEKEMEGVLSLERRGQTVKKQVMKTRHSISLGFMLLSEIRKAFSLMCTNVLSTCQTRMVQVFIQRNSAM